jgi:hypothetical protein
MLVRPQVIVPNPKQPQGRFKLVARIDFPAIEFFLQGAEEAFDAPIHPRAARFSRLVLDIEQPQYDLKPFGLVVRFILGAV